HAVEEGDEPFDTAGGTTCGGVGAGVDTQIGLVVEFSLGRVGRCEGVGEGMEDRKAQVVEDALSGFGVRPVDRDEHTRIDFRKQYVAGVQTAEVTTMAHTPR